ncbi:hypothetical protein BHE74_00044234 [Ensete ventricosum]|nr:hypothetical protein BHE74_00044234 [Ensete ventricosum]
MEVTLSKARKAYPDCSAVASKLRAQLYNAEEQLRAQQHQTSYLTHLTARTFPRGLHCLSMRLTTEYFALQPEQRKFCFSLAPRSGAGRRRARIARFPEAFQLMRFAGAAESTLLRGGPSFSPSYHHLNSPRTHPLTRIHIIFWASLSTQKPPINPVADKTNPPRLAPQSLTPLPAVITPPPRVHFLWETAAIAGPTGNPGRHHGDVSAFRSPLASSPDRVVVHAKFPLPTTPTSVVSTTGGSPGPTCRKRLREGYQECAASGHSDAGMRMCGRRSSVYYTHGVASRLIVRAAREKSPPSNKSSY